MRPRKLTKFQERVLLEEVRMGRRFTTKKIAERYGISVWCLSNYTRRFFREGLM